MVAEGVEWRGRPRPVLRLQEGQRRTGGETLNGLDFPNGIIRPMSITYKDADGIAGMRVAGRLASEVLDYLTPTSSPASPPTSSTAWRTTTWSTCRAPSPPR
jgi:hypothetical protein